MAILGKQRGIFFNWRMAWRKANLRSRVIFSIIPLVLSGVLFLLPSCSPAEFTGEPRISFDQDSVSLGEATPDQPILYTFHFQNVGNAPLVLHDITIETLEGC